MRYDVRITSPLSGSKATISGPIRLDALHEFLTGPRDDATMRDALLTVEQAYRFVPWERRAVNLIANAVAHVPFALWSGEEDVAESNPFALQLPRLLNLTARSIEKNGRAYWLLESNRLGRNVMPRFIPAKSVKPIVDRERGLTGFNIGFSSSTRDFPLEQIIYFHLPNDDSEIEADTAPSATAVEAASLLWAANRVASKFYAGGMVQTSLVIVPTATQEEELQRIEGFFKRMATGLRNVFRVLAVRAGVDVRNIGQTIRDARMPELIAEARDDVAVAHDIPPTVLDGKAANFATAQSEWYGFYITKVIPMAEWIESEINLQFLSPLNLRLEFQSQRLEIMQAAQLEQAQATQALYNPLPGDGIIDRAEARDLVGFAMHEETEQPEKRSPNGKAGKAAPNAPDDDRRRRREREMMRRLERYFDDLRQRILADAR